MFSGAPNFLIRRLLDWKRWDEPIHAGNEWSLEVWWDFKYLVASEPPNRHYKAAQFVYEQLKPTLKFTTWPVDPHFSFVHKAMPALTGQHGWHRQYHTLLKRVRAASVSRWRSRNWWRIQNVLVQRVMTNGALMATLGQTSPWRFLSHGTKQCLLGLIGELVGGCQPCVSSGQPFRVNIGSLAAVGFGNTLRTARTKRSAQVFRGGVGSFASLAFKPLQGRIVRIKSTERTLDDNAVADSILGDKFFTSLDSKGLHCWHVVRVFHRSRMMRGAESSCERLGVVDAQSVGLCCWLGPSSDRVPLVYPRGRSPGVSV